MVKVRLTLAIPGRLTSFAGQAPISIHRPSLACPILA
jgi:hypothetical protein